MPYMYILECADGSYYTGSTWDLERRLWEHQNGLGAKHTAKRLPVTLLYCEECERIEDAYIREKQIQGWSRKKKQALMAGNMNQIHHLAECQNESHWRNVGIDASTSSEHHVTQLNDSTQPADFCEQTTTTQTVSQYRSLSEVEGNNASHSSHRAPFGSAQGTEGIDSFEKSQ
jgi:putative endonuclease